MPCGQLDKRRGGHRCAACRKSHQRCDGNQPCSNCQQRGITCTFPRRTTPLQIVRVTSTPAKALTQTPWRYICLFFNGMGILPQSAVLGSDPVITLSNTDEHVNTILVTIGQVYAASSGLNTLNGQERANLLVDGTGDGWRAWTRVVCDNLVNRIAEDMAILSPFDKELIRFLQLNAVLGALSNNERAAGSDFAAQMMQRPLTPIFGSPTSYTQHYEQALSVMWRWSHLLQSINQWTAATGGISNEMLSLEKKIEGIELVRAVSHLQSNIIEILLASPESYEPNCRFLDPYFRWVLVGMSRRLQYPDIHHLECSLPIMPLECLHDQALSTLNELEEMTSHCALDVAVFLPLADHMGDIIESKQDLGRVIRFLSHVEACGFAVAREYREEFEIISEELKS
ncbi:fungal specific transcription factor domain-containing [Fusarium albosuccineum]|uniref:Fungal specific transcription factor domain-containing n=1 Tax=Fusarium albosuccineum TaxID=1237068 RepID=A0A8H4LAI3_9HYPO|nr:fungal specific transcription factor domain-containing [Fusarium albosuccineum]